MLVGPRTVLCIGAASAVAAASVLLLGHPGSSSASVPRTVEMAGTVSPPSVMTSGAALDLDLPELPAPLAGLDGPEAGSPSAAAARQPSLFETLSAGESIGFRPAFGDALPASRFVAESAPPAAPAIETMIRREVARRDLTLGALSVRPPPRPVFREQADRPSFADPGLADASVATAVTTTSLDGAIPAPSSSLFSGFGVAREAEPEPRPGRPLQSGMASWYGPGFHGRKTASGERFDQMAMTAAHRTLPFGTRVRVVDPKTGRSIVVRINDRGPFAHGRIIDLSKGSALALGMLSTSPVKLVGVVE